MKTLTLAAGRDIASYQLPRSYLSAIVGLLLSVATGTGALCLSAAPRVVDLGGRDVVALKADPVRGLVYGLNDGAGGGVSSVVAFDGATGEIAKEIAIADAPMDFALTPSADALMVIHNHPVSVTKIDLAAFSTAWVKPVAGMADATFPCDIEALGRDVVGYTDGDWAPAARVYDFTTGTELTMFVLEGYGVGNLAFTKDGKTAYSWAQFGWGGGSGPSFFCGVDLSNQSNPTVKTKSIASLARDPTDTPVLLTTDEQRVFCKGYCFDANDLSRTVAAFTEQIYAITPQGELAAGQARVFAGRTGASLYVFPFATSVSAFSADLKNLLLLNAGAKQLAIVPVRDIADASAQVSLPAPPEDAIVQPSLEALSWASPPFALACKVYLGADEGEVRDASEASATYLGHTDQQSFALSLLEPGTTYYWRIDVQTVYGVVKGPVWRFHMASVIVTPSPINAVAIAGYTSAPVTVRFQKAGEQAAWSVWEEIPWLSLSTTNGVAPSETRILFDTASLPAGSYTNLIYCTAGSFTFAVPVQLRVVAMNLSRMAADLDRPYIYALHPGTGSPEGALLVFINTRTEQVEKFLSIGGNPTDLTVNRAEGRLYVSDWQQPFTRRVDLETQTELPPLQIGMANYGWDGYRINAGRAGRLYLEGNDQWVMLSVVDTSSGAIVRQITVFEGDGEADPTGEFYYHCKSRVSSAKITKYRVSDDSMAEVAYSPVHSPGSRNLVMSADGSRLFWYGYAYDANLAELGWLGEEIYAASAQGEIAIGSAKAYGVAQGKAIYTLPFQSSVMAVAGDQEKLFLFNGAKKQLAVVRMTEVAAALEPALVPAIPDAGVVALPISRLGWSTMPGALYYEVYLGQDSNAVAVAGRTSPEYLGLTNTAAVLVPANALSVGRTYYWRVDFKGPYGMVTGAVWRFHVAPATVEPGAVELRVPAGLGVPPVELRIKQTPADLAWNVSVSTNWLAAAPAAGIGEGGVTLQIDPAGLGVGTNVGEVVIRLGEQSVRIPVELTVFVMNLSQMAADLDRSYIYALHSGPGTGEGALLLFINTRTETADKVLPIGGNPTDLTIHRAEKRLYVSDWQQPFTRRVDLETQTELPPLQIGMANYGWDDYGISAGRAGRLYLEGRDQWVNLSAVDTSTGAIVRQIRLYQGDGEVDPTGDFYYHCDKGISSANIAKYRISDDSLVAVANSPVHGNSLRNLVMCPDGSRLFWCGYVYDANLRELGRLGEEIHATSLRGEIALGSANAYRVADGKAIYALPFQSYVMAVSGDPEKLFLFNRANGELAVIPMKEIGAVSGPGLAPGIPDGGVASLPINWLEWSTVPGAFRYEVFLGRNSNAVAAASRTSPEYLSLAKTNAIHAPVSILTFGQTYYWRVDFEGPLGVVTGGVWSFRVAPAVIEPTAIELHVPAGLPCPNVELQIKQALPDLAWSVSVSTNWLEAAPTAGVGAARVTVKIDSAGLGIDTHAGEVVVRLGGESLRIPVELSLFEMNISRMAADLDRPYIYALHPGSGSPEGALLLFINTRTEQVDKVLHLGACATDLTISRAEGRLYVSDWQKPFTRRVDLESQTELPPLQIGTAGGGWDDYRINAGRAGRLYLEGYDQWVALSAVDTLNGTMLCQARVFAGDGEVDPTGSFYYHCDKGITKARITKYAISDTSLTEAATSPVRYPGSRNLIMSPDGSRLFWCGYVYDADLKELANLGDEIYACTRQGLFAFSSTKVYDAERAQPNDCLPCQTTVLAVAGEQDKLFFFDSQTHRVAAAPLAELINRAPQVGNLTLTAAENTPLAFELVGQDPDGDAVQFQLGQLPAFGVLEGTLPNLTYRPSADFNGCDSFTYFAHDQAKTSVVATVTITVTAVNAQPAEVLQPPLGGLVVPGGSLRLEVKAGGTAPLSFQWQRGGVDLIGETASSLLISNMTEALDGTYRVTVSNVWGQAVSLPAVVLMRPSGRLGAPTFNREHGLEFPVALMPGATGNIQASEDLINWKTVGTATGVNERPVWFLDPLAAQYRKRFYRLTFP